MKFREYVVLCGLLTTAACHGLSSKSALSSIPDSQIGDAVHEQLGHDPITETTDLAVQVSRGVATLSGQVATLLVRDRALRVAETIKGVRSVMDHMTVSAANEPDNEVKADIEKAFADDPIAHGANIQVDLVRGVATVSGIADTWQERRLFDDVAKGVPGVVRLQDAITIRDVTRQRTDRDIANEIKQRVAYDAYLDGSHVDVDVKDGHVRLAGTVGSAALRDRAYDDAWVEGAREVNPAGLGIDWNPSNADVRSPGAVRDMGDTAIAAAVRQSFRHDPRLSRSAPVVSVLGGIVELTGNLDDIRASQAATQDATYTVGVTEVQNHTTVEPNIERSDVDVARGVEKSILADSRVPEGKGLQIEASNGKVVISGALKSAGERARVLGDVARAPGVKSMEDNILLHPRPEQLESSIRSAFAWDPLIEPGKIDVTVSPDGTATLTGVTRLWATVRAAGDDAKRSGAREVNNLITLKIAPALP